MTRVNFDDSDRIRMTADGTLTLTDVVVEDSAKYVCKADNNYGEAVIESAFVIVRTKTKVVKGPEHAMFYQGEIVPMQSERVKRWLKQKLD